MLIFISFILAASATVSSSSDTPHSHQQQQHRILTNAETGTITHPLISHNFHLARRRRELRERYGAQNIDTSLPPRPHTSRHNNKNEAADSVISSILPASKDTSDQNNNLRRRLQQQMGALYQGYGTHYVDLWVGSPTPQRQTVIVDTGSGVTAFPCEECKGCGDTYHTDNYFRHSESTTFRPLDCNECFRGYCATVEGSKKCRISMSYAEGSSWSAYEAMDLCYAGGPHDVALNVDGAHTNLEQTTLDYIDPVDASQFAFELAFGCQVSITGLFITQLADGIMGMENEKTAFWKQMHTKNAIPRPEFSLCFSRSDDAERDGTSAGAMTMGGVDPRLHNVSPMVFAKNVKGSGFYAVHLKAVYLREGGGISAQTTQADMAKMHNLGLSEADLNRGNVIVDSGTTDTYFTSRLAEPFKKVYKKLTGHDYNHNPVDLTSEQIDKLPTLILVISGYDGDANVGDEPTGDPNDVAGYVGDVPDLSDNPRDIILAIPAAHYMEYDPDTKKYVPRFYTEESSGSVLGANAMMGHDVYFDTQRGRIGFAESDCDYVSLLLNEGSSISVAPQQPQEKVSAKIEVPVEEEQQEEEVMLPPPVEMEVDDAFGEDDEEFFQSTDDAAFNTESSSTSENETPYEIFPGNDKPQGGNEGGGGFFSDLAGDILDDMKHECSSAGCRGIAALVIMGAAAIVIVGIRRTLARRRVVRQYQEAELEISDLALDSDSDDDDHQGGYVDEPPDMPQIT